MHSIGEILSLTTAVCWALGSILFNFAGRRVGPFTINIIRIVFAAILLFFLALDTEGSLLPKTYESWQITVLICSAIIGLIIADGCYFKALVTIGPRLASLTVATGPVFGTIISWLALGQKLALIDLLGIAITVGGIVSVTLEKSVENQGVRSNHPLKGYLFGVASGLGQAVAITTARYGMADNISPLQTTTIRMLSAAVVIMLFAAMTKRLPEVFKAFRDSKAMAAISAASLLGPIIGIWLSMVAILYTKIGIAMTLMSTTPILVIPLVIIIHKERPSLRAIVGTIVAVGGIAILLLL